MKNKKKFIFWIVAIIAIGGIVGTVIMRRKPESSYESRPTAVSYTHLPGGMCGYHQ